MKKILSFLLRLIIVFIVVCSSIVIYIIIQNQLNSKVNNIPANASGKLYIVQSLRSGFTLIQPPDPTQIVDTSKKSIKLKNLNQEKELELYLTNVNKKTITLNLYNPSTVFLYKKTETLRHYNGDDCKEHNMTMTIKRGETIAFATCSLDSGITWYITYVK